MSELEFRVQCYESHLTTLQKAVPNERGYLIGSISECDNLVLFESTNVIERPQSVHLFEPGDLKAVMPYVLEENKGYIPFTSNPDEQAVLEEALAMFTGHSNSPFEQKLFAYCLAGKEPQFKRVHEATPGVSTVLEISYAALRNA